MKSRGRSAPRWKRWSTIPTLLIKTEHLGTQQTFFILDDCSVPAAVTAGAPLFPVPPPQEIRLVLSGKRDSDFSDLLSRPAKKKAKKQLSEKELAEFAAKKLLDDSRRERECKCKDESFGTVSGSSRWKQEEMHRLQ